MPDPFFDPFLLAHGLDNLQAGIREAFTNQSVNTATVQLLQKAGMSHNAAHVTNDMGVMLGTMGAAAAVASSASAAMARNAAAAQRLRFPAGFAKMYPKELGEILNITKRVGRDGDAIEVLFKNGKKMDINPVRIKEWVPNLHPKAPLGTLQKVEFPNFLPNSKGFKRIPSKEELDFFNTIISE